MKNKNKAIALRTLWILHVTFMFFLFPAIAIRYSSGIMGVIWFAWLITMCVLVFRSDNHVDFGDF